MLIEYNPDDYEAVIEHDTCEFHKKHPNQRHAGCTCFSSYSLRKKSESERLLLKEKLAMVFCDKCGTALGVD